MIIKINQNELVDIVEKALGNKIDYIELKFSDYSSDKGSFVNKKNLSKIENVEMFKN